MNFYYTGKNDNIVARAEVIFDIKLLILVIGHDN